MDDLYRDNILDHFKYPKNYGRITKSDATYEENNPLCGDKIGMFVKLDNQNRIRDIKFNGFGCAISISSASMLTEIAKGKKAIKIKNMATGDILKMLGIQLTPIRLKCALLPLEVLKIALALVKK